MRRGFEFFRTVEQLFNSGKRFFVIFGTIEQFIKHNSFINNGAAEQFFNSRKQFFVIFGTIEQFKQLVKFCGRHQYIKRARE
ncbi:MAG: hypothetical protein MSR67_01270 [Oscillospiraceae bacterium]|nr:hypothetical protein [Oscillospiraceae bacterium]